jgi:hypothetical protein
MSLLFWDWEKDVSTSDSYSSSVLRFISEFSVDSEENRLSINIISSSLLHSTFSSLVKIPEFIPII